MRELKFRAWLPALKKMSHPFDIFHVPLKENMDDCPIMQFTGLLDKFGKEIWEGDITRVGDMTHRLEVVSFENGSFKQTDPKTGMVRFLGNHHPSWFEVIGNIWESPEILKGANES